MIQVSSLSFSYRKNKELFKDLSIDLNPGNIYGLLGKNGAGKTTLLRLMSGMLFPKQGKCQMNGKDTSLRDPSFLQDIYFLPEEFSLPAITLKNYAEVNAVFYPKFSRKEFKKYINEFDLDVDQKLNTMSYGQKKKYLMAFGLATQAVFMILDEPTNGLDIPSKSQYRKIMASTISDERCFIISTHQVRDLENLIDPVIILDKGRIIFNQSSENITSKLIFGEIQQYNDIDILFKEGLEGKEKGVVVNHTNTSTSLDLELLFNAVVQQDEKIQKLFNA